VKTVFLLGLRVVPGQSGAALKLVLLYRLIAFSSDITMALLPILKFPDPRLHTVAKPVQEVDDRIRKLVKDMAETMYDAPGVGLAATQVDVHERVVVIDVSESGNELLVLINPEITWKSEELKVYEEGCLSVPDTYDKVERAANIRFKAQNEKGEWYEKEADGLLAVCVQHELDHLDGKVFVEYLSVLKRERIRSRLRKQQREALKAGQ
jgi:peptide deformylase